MTEAPEKRTYAHAQCSACGKNLTYVTRYPGMTLEGLKTVMLGIYREVDGGTLYRCLDHPFEEDER